MGCLSCTAAQREGWKYHYRWKEANIIIVGCAKHTEDVVAALNRAQEPKVVQVAQVREDNEAAHGGSSNG